jgi:drug/metabolite transporter (DMT)-like permease
MLAVQLSLIACICWGLSQFLAGIKTRELPVLTLLIYTSTSGLTVFLIATLVRGAPIPHDPKLGFAFLGGVAGIFGVYSLYRGLAVGSVSIVVPISALCALVPVTVGLIQGETPQPIQAIGIVAALCGGVLISFNKNTDTEKNPATRGIIPAVGAALGFGTFFVMMDVAGAVDPLWAAATTRLTSWLLVLSAVVLNRPPVKINIKHLPVVILIGALDSAAALAYTASTTQGMLSLVSVVSSLYPVVSVGLAAIFLKERLSRIQLIGFVLIIAGIAMIST